jgi:hypothetical protein
MNDLKVNEAERLKLQGTRKVKTFAEQLDLAGSSAKVQMGEASGERCSARTGAEGEVACDGALEEMQSDVANQLIRREQPWRR